MCSIISHAMGLWRVGLNLGPSYPCPMATVGEEATYREGQD